jgi:hypothetical protein
MDDFVILDTDKVKLFEIRKLIKNFLNLNLKLELHPKKSEYCPVDKGVDFLGFVVFEKYILLRKSTAKRFIKKLRNKIKNLKSEDRRNILKKSFLS